MPEGHTLHGVARAWQPLVGRRVSTTSPQGRFAAGARILDGRVVQGVQAFGKHLLVDFDGIHLHVHLGLEGAVFEVAPGTTPGSGVRLRMAAPPEGPTWDLVAPSRCELLDEAARRNLLARLGPDPLRGDDPDPAFRQIGASSRPIGALLLDQRVIAGVGNVFRAEVLHLCGLHPDRQGSSLTSEDLRCLWTTLTRLMERATREGRIVTVEVQQGADRAALDPAEGRFVYKQARCRDCDGEVRTWTLAGRTAYACETCQPAG